MGYSMNTDAYHYIEWYDWDHKKGMKGALKNVELFDRNNDPYEMVNIADDLENSELKKELAKQLKAGWRAAQPN